jgi:hypothetical protein
MRTTNSTTHFMSSSKTTDSRDWSTNSFPVIVASSTLRQQCTVPEKRINSPILSLSKRNEALAREIGRVKEINRRQKEVIRNLSTQLLHRDQGISKGTQTGLEDEAVMSTPLRSTFKLLERLSLTGSLDLPESTETKNIISPVPQLANLFPDNSEVDSPFLVNPLVVDQTLREPDKLVKRDKLDSTTRKTSRKAARNVLSYQEPSLKVKVRKGFKFFKTKLVTTDG